MTEKFSETDSLLTEGQEYDVSYLDEARELIYSYMDEDIEEDTETENELE